MKKAAGRQVGWLGVVSIALLAVLFLGTLNIVRPGPVHVDYPSHGLYVVTEEDGGATAHTDPLHLPKGLYDVNLSYQCPDGGHIWISGTGNGPQSYYAQTQELDPYVGQKTMRIWVNDPLDDFCIHVFSQYGAPSVSELSVTEADNSRLYQVVCLALPLLLIELLAACIHFRRRLEKYAVVGVGLGGITLIASLGMLTRYMPFGHDLQFHLLRIEGLKDALLSGSFPARIQPNWVGGWGYAVSVMYGDVTILFPAVLRIIGFTVQTSYKAFIIALNFLTALSSYYTFHQICKDRNISLLGSLFYTTAPYRLCCILTRGAFGEYAAMLFLPLVALGFWRAFGEDPGGAGYGKKLLLPVIGLAGLLQTHILTCQMALLFIVPLCAVLWRKTIRKKTLLYLAKLAGFSVLISAWFLVPFLRYYQEDLVCTQWAEMAPDYQVLGVSLTELFAPEASGSYGYNWSELTSLGDKFSIPLSNALLLFILIALLALWKRQLPQHKRAVSIVLVMGVVSVWMATNLFPYHFLQVHAPALAKFLSKPGLPYRYLSLACLLLSLLAVLTLWQLSRRLQSAPQRTSPGIQVGALVLVGCIAISQSLGFTYRSLYGGTFCVYYDGGELSTNNLMGEEYLYQGSSVAIAMAERTPVSSSVSIVDYTRAYNTFDITCGPAGADAWLEVPLFYYPGYTAQDNAGDVLPVKRGDNNRLRVPLAEGYSGTVHIAFREPLLWRVAEAVSLLSALVLIYLHLPEKYRRISPSKRSSSHPLQKVR